MPKAKSKLVKKQKVVVKPIKKITKVKPVEKPKRVIKPIKVVIKTVKKPEQPDRVSGFTKSPWRKK